MDEKRKVKRIQSRNPVTTHCVSCGRDTKHKPLFIYRVAHETEYSDFCTDYMILECGGCEMVSFCRREYIHDAIGDDPQYLDRNLTADDDYDIKEFTFLRDDDQDMLPSKISDLYEEIKTQFITNSELLAGVGLRMLVEAVCLQQNIAGRNLQQKIKQLNTDGLISNTEFPILDKLRVIGNDSAHKIKPLPIDKLAYALDVINHILKSIYILPKINKKLRVDAKSKTSASIAKK